MLGMGTLRNSSMRDKLRQIQQEVTALSAAMRELSKRDLDEDAAATLREARMAIADMAWTVTGIARDLDG